MDQKEKKHYQEMCIPVVGRICKVLSFNPAYAVLLTSISTCGLYLMDSIDEEIKNPIDVVLRARKIILDFINALDAEIADKEKENKKELH